MRVSRKAENAAQHDLDFYSWTQTQAAMLRDGRVTETPAFTIDQAQGETFWPQATKPVRRTAPKKTGA